MFFFTKAPKYDFRQQFEPYAESHLWALRKRLRCRKSQGQRVQGIRLSGRSEEINPKGRNKRTVWRITSENNHEMHYAAFPIRRNSLETPVEAGCPPGGVVLDPFLGEHDRRGRPKAREALHRYRAESVSHKPVCGWNGNPAPRKTVSHADRTGGCGRARVSRTSC